MYTVYKELVPGSHTHQRHGSVKWNLWNVLPGYKSVITLGWVGSVVYTHYGFTLGEYTTKAPLPWDISLASYWLPKKNERSSTPQQSSKLCKLQSQMRELCVKIYKCDKDEQKTTQLCTCTKALTKYPLRGDTTVTSSGAVPITNPTMYVGTPCCFACGGGEYTDARKYHD